MKYIAHRGLLAGPNASIENSPDTVMEVLKAGYDCEVDVRYLDGKWFLGHDEPTYEVKEEFLHQHGLWIHCKNSEALEELIWTPLNYFWHQEDAYTLTSHRFIWAYPGQPLSPRAIMVMPEWEDPSFDKAVAVSCAGVCSDFAGLIKKMRERAS